ncbi:MAG: hypothetical protein RIR50_918, partial [Pseudomonadota bacterium]
MKKTDQEYQATLSDIEYRVTRQAATEHPFSGRYWDHWKAGKYDCVCCGTPLFALALVGMPIKVLSNKTIARILEGGAEACRSAG